MKHKVPFKNLFKVITLLRNHSKKSRHYPMVLKRSNLLTRIKRVMTYFNIIKRTLILLYSHMSFMQNCYPRWLTVSIMKILLGPVSKKRENKIKIS